MACKLHGYGFIIYRILMNLLTGMHYYINLKRFLIEEVNESDLGSKIFKSELVISLHEVVETDRHPTSFGQIL